MATTSAQIQQLYVAYLGRAADKAGLDYWLNATNGTSTTPATLTLDDLRTNFTTQQTEYTSVYGGLTREETVVKIYNNLFGRAPDADGLTYWTTGGGASVSTDLLLTSFINGASADDSKVVTNKVLVAEVYTSAAGTNFASADAKSVITGVTSDYSTVGTALEKLTDGSLGGIAIPAAVANLKAAAAADGAFTSYESTNTTTLKDLSTKLAALTKADANLTDTTATTANTYGDANTSVDNQLDAARAELGGDTKALTTTATTADATLAAARTSLLTDSTYGVGATDKIKAYTDAQAAVKAAPVAPTLAEKTVAIDTLTSIATANATEFAKALTAAGLTASSPADAAADANALYNKLADGATTDTVSANVATEFGSVSAYASVKTTVDKAHAIDKAADALTVAEDALDFGTGNAWISAYNADVTANSKLASSKALDALEASYKTVVDGHTAVETSVSTANGKLDATDALDTAGANLTVQAAADDTKAEVFYFANNKVTGADGALTLAAGGDSLYIGEGYTQNKAATLGDTGIVGGDNNSKEVFFFKGTDGVVKAVIETGVASSLAVTNTASLNTAAADGVSVITLTGVTDLAKVGFDAGVISVHA
jgi:hypothetical protein